MIEYFGEIGILNKSLLKDNILTSADIQSTWLNAKKLQRTQLKNVDLKYWLLVDTLSTQIDKFESNVILNTSKSGNKILNH